jgi:hypothetical protein
MGMSMHSLIESSNQIKSKVYRSLPMLHSLVEGLLDTTGPQDLSAITAQDWPLDISTPLTLIGTKLTQYGLTSSTTN